MVTVIAVVNSVENVFWCDFSECAPQAAGDGWHSPWEGSVGSEQLWCHVSAGRVVLPSSVCWSGADEEKPRALSPAEPSTGGRAA